MTEQVKKPGLGDALKQLDKAVTDTLAHFMMLDVSDLPNLLKNFNALKAHKEHLDNLQKLLTQLYQEMSYEKIPQAMEAQGFDSVRVGKRLFSIATRINASIPADMRDAGFKWLTDDAKCPELIVPTVNSKQLSSFVTGYFETHGKWPPEDAVKIHKQTYTQVRAS